MVEATQAAVEAEQIVGPVTSYPGLHVGWHDEFTASVLVHVPTAPLVGASTVQFPHVAAVSWPVSEQLVGPEAAYPWLHAGWHRVPGARLLMHVPKFPLMGAVKLHIGTLAGAQVDTDASVKPVLAQSVNPDNAYPALHFGSHQAPAGMLLLHEPRFPLVGALTAHSAARVGATVLAGAIVFVGAGVILLGVGVGSRVGCCEGALVGPRLGDPEGCRVGVSDGAVVGRRLGGKVPGNGVGKSVGVRDGTEEGIRLGCTDGAIVGSELAPEGVSDGIRVGKSEGVRDGATVGTRVGWPDGGDVGKRVGWSVLYAASRDGESDGTAVG